MYLQVQPEHLPEAFVDKYKDSKVDWGFNGLGYLTYKRTYAAKIDVIKGKDIHEEWYQTVARVVSGWMTWYKNQLIIKGKSFSRDSALDIAYRMYDAIFTFKMLPPGRGLQHMGRDSVNIKGGAILNNCGFVTTKGSSQSTYQDPFIYMMDMLMLGVGVGYDTEAYKYNITVKKPRLSTKPFVVEDTREGWLKTLSVVIRSFMDSRNMLPVTFDYSKIRKAGSELKTIGGTASGAAPLMQLVEDLIRLYTAYEDKPVDSTLISDSMNMIGRCVVSGGIRRSSQIGLGDIDDDSFYMLKDHRGVNPTDDHPINNYRWASNDSMLCHVGQSYKYISECIYDIGSPGCVWLDNYRHYGRFVDGYNTYHDNVEGVNPCIEQGLESKELCNLVESFPANCESLREWNNTLTLAYLYAKVVSSVPVHDKDTQEVITRNRRLGISISGIQQAKAKYGKDNFYKAVKESYENIKWYDLNQSRHLGMNRSVKLTSVKPSGTVSLLAGATPGIHHDFSEYYIRRMRLSEDSYLIPILMKSGIEVVEALKEPRTVIAEFPVHVNNFSKCEKDLTIKEQMEDLRLMQKLWADNAVSITVKYNKEQTIPKDIEDAISDYDKEIKSVSFMAIDNHGYTQPPYQSIGEKEYLKRSSCLNLKGFNAVHHDTQDLFCDGNTCTPLPVSK